jgi:hypothetical protein|tara:strand:+ start:144 stop:401 length:258 start_codon:yes stop_codon:yes gene_type:complete
MMRGFALAIWLSISGNFTRLIPGSDADRAPVFQVSAPLIRIGARRNAGRHGKSEICAHCDCEKTMGDPVDLIAYPIPALSVRPGR